MRMATFWLALEPQPSCEDGGMIVGIEMRQRDLFARANRQRQDVSRAGRTAHQRKPAENDAWSIEGLLPAVVRSTLVEGGVELVFNPDKARGVVLNRIIPDDAAAQFCGVRHGDGAAGGGRHGELSEALAEFQRGRQDRAAASVAVLSGGDAGAHVGGDDSVVMLLVAAVNPHLAAKRDVAEAVDRFGIVVQKEWRRADSNLKPRQRNELETLGVAKVPGLSAARNGLADEIRAQPLLDASIRRYERSGPVRLVHEG